MNMTPKIWFAAMCGLEAVLTVVVLVGWLRDKRALARLVASASTVERMREVAMALPSAYRASATQFAGEMVRKGSLDEALVAAVTRAASASYGLRVAWSLLLRVALGLGALGPFVIALFGTALEIRRVLPPQDRDAPTRVFLATKHTLEPTFVALKDATQQSGVLVVGLVMLACLDWLLSRPEVREARFVQSILRAAIAARPGAPAPVSGRLSELLSPERSLHLPVAAFIFFFLAVSLGWCLLFLTASVRAANAADVYDVWPANRRKLLVAPSGMRLPLAGGGGQPIQKEGHPTLTVGPDHVELSTVHLAELTNGSHLIPGWRQHIQDPSPVLASFKTESSGLQIAVLAHQGVLMSTVLELLGFLRSTQDLRLAHLVVERNVRFKDAPGGLRLDASLSLRTATDPSTPPPKILIAITAKNVTLRGPSGEALTVELDSAKWRRDLSRATRTLIADPQSSEIVIQTDDPDLTYARFMEILSTADSTCEQDVGDCGVPGIGLTFVLAP